MTCALCTAPPFLLHKYGYGWLSYTPPPHLLTSAFLGSWCSRSVQKISGAYMKGLSLAIWRKVRLLKWCKGVSCSGQKWSMARPAERPRLSSHPCRVAQLLSGGSLLAATVCLLVLQWFWKFDSSADLFTEWLLCVTGEKLIKAATTHWKSEGNDLAVLPSVQ